jgi:hypothetical protein
VNISLIDDGLVEKEKIGGSNYFWSFPGKKDRLAQLEHQNTLVEIERLQGVLQETTAQLADAKRGREEDGDGGRAAKLELLADMAKERAALELEYAKLKENDPQVAADLEKELNLVTQAAHRWTDNIFQCQTYLVKKRGMEKKQVVRVFGCVTYLMCQANFEKAKWIIAVPLVSLVPFQSLETVPPPWDQRRF